MIVHWNPNPERQCQGIEEVNIKHSNSMMSFFSNFFHNIIFGTDCCNSTVYLQNSNL